MFVRHVSHEIRTPLNTTVLGLKLLDHAIKNDENQDASFVEDLLSDISSSCATAIDILNDLLLYEKIEGGLVSLETEDTEVWELVKEVAKMFRIQVNSHI